MRLVDIAQQRLHNQYIAEPTFLYPKDVVEWLGAVQAQDYAAALWAVGLRLQDVRSDDLEQAFADGTILRTHVMRPTWHFVSPVDIRWLLALTAPRVNAGNASRYRQLELDGTIFVRSQEALVKALQGGKQLLDARGNILFSHTMILDGRVVGTWKRTLTKDRVVLTPSLFTALGRAETDAFVLSANRYGTFLDRSATLTFQEP